MSHSIEDIKAASHRLRGSLLDSLADPLTARWPRTTRP
jgi:sulfite reductase (NADPH) hemoprotein beta-component